MTAEGEIIDYTITVQNTGGLTITGWQLPICCLTEVPVL
ncbi:MAG: hypothetical protein IPF54_04290 [Draconibacterium sp.]|nr:hypothetical protein [Draconibacterium sp.]